MSKELPLTLSSSNAASPVVATGLTAGVVPGALQRPSTGVGSALMEEATNAARLRAATARRQKPVTLSLPTVRLGGVALHAVSEQTAIETILSELECGRGGTVVTPNLDHLKRCGSDVTFRALVEESDLVVADGMPLVWASKFQGTPLPERVAGSNLIGTLSEAAAAAGRRIFLLGGDPGQAEGAAEALRGRYPDLDVGGTYCPPYGFEYDTKEMAKIVDLLTESRPDIIFVALGSPKQEKLINQIKRTLPDAWWLGVGISFSFLTGHVRRAPQWMQSTGLEWVHRLGQEPKRLFKRYVVHGIPFFTKLMSGALWYRARNAVGMAPRPVAKQIASDRVFLPAADSPAGEEVRLDVDAVSSTVNRTLDPQTQLDSDANARAVDEAIELAACDQPESAVVASLEVGTDAQAVLKRLRGLVLLGGRVRPSDFTARIGQPSLELPLTNDSRLMDAWLHQADRVADYAGLEWLPLQVIVTDEHDAPQLTGPAHVKPRPAGAFTVVRDMSAYRGTGGVLHDLACEYDDDDLILVCNAGQVVIDPLDAQVRALAQKIARGADIALIAHDDGTPCGSMLIRCGTLRGIKSIGYVDMKEQALPRIAEEHVVKTVHTRLATGLPVRTREAYIAALQRYHSYLVHRGRGSEPNPLGENYTKHFSIVEPSANVDPSAHLHDSVVLAGATVEAGATLVRSVVCRGGLVKARSRLVDTTVCGDMAHNAA